MSLKTAFLKTLEDHQYSEDKNLSNKPQIKFHTLKITDHTAKSELRYIELLTSEILGLLINTLANDKKYPLLNRENLTIPIQMQLSQKQKTFLNFLLLF